MAELLDQIGQQLRDLQSQLTAAQAENERLREVLAAKDEEVALVKMPRLIRLLYEGDPGYVDMDDVKTVRQRLADRDLALKELKDMARRNPSQVVGRKLRKHDWTMTEIAEALPAEWQHMEQAQEVESGIKERMVEIELSPPPSPGRTALKRKTLPVAGKECPEGNNLELENEEDLPRTPQQHQTDSVQQETNKDRKQPSPGQDAVITSVETITAPIDRTKHTSDKARMFPKRNPVCVDCWESRQWCNSSALCSNCSASEKKCVYKKCKFGAKCRNSHCVFMHPDQWSEQDKTWAVVEGSLRAKMPANARPRDPRERYVDGASTKKRRRSGDALDEDLIRKSVCKHCFHARQLCDFNGRCFPCREANIKCVRIHCKLGLSCRSKRCPCVHPGQYDLTDTTWNVDHGNL